MKDIKNLYLAAKHGKEKQSVSIYEDTVHQLLENSPIDYLTNVEYIIESSIGLASLKPFIEKYGLSIAAYDIIKVQLEKCIDKCINKNLSHNKYDEAISYLEAYKDKYSNCFHMYEYFQNELNDKYMMAYYSENSNGVPNKKLVKGMINTFGECAIPDLLITANEIGESAINQTMKFIAESKLVKSETFCQWITECAKDIAIFNNAYLESVSSNNIETKLNDMYLRHNIVYRESKLVEDKSNLVLGYTEADILAIEDGISFYEFMVTCTDEPEEIKSYQEKTLSLYDELDGLVTESVADSVISMLPFANVNYHKNATSNSGLFKKITGYPEEKKVQNNITDEEKEYDQNLRSIKESENFNEDTWMNNTHDKKTGDIPGYLKRNHNLSYGEDDNDNPSLDDFKRKTPESKPISDEDDDSLSIDTNLDDETIEEEPKPTTSPVNNYYYYNYQNSLNRNTNSFNKDNSVRDSHNSTSYDYSGNNRNNDNSVKNNNDDVEESCSNNTFNEGFTDFIKKGFNKFKSLIMKKSLANLQKFDDPKVSLAKKVPTLIGTNIPLKLDEVKVESTSVVEKDIFTESVESADTLLSKKEFKSIIKNLSNKFNTDIVFIDLNKNQGLSELLQAAALIQISKKDLMKYKFTKTLDLNKLDNNMAFNPNRERVIFVNKDIIETFKITKPRDLELILTHEYGHVLTYNQLTADDWLEYNIKRKIISAILGIYLNSPNYAEKMMDANVCYHKLKPERIANEAVGINPIELLESIYKRKFVDDFKEFDFDYLVNWKIPENIWKVNANPNSDKNTFIKAIDESVELYKHCIKDPKILESFINASNYHKQQFENSLNEKVSFNESNDGKPESDHPVKDTIMDIDQKTIKAQQAAKKKVQDIQNVGKALVKPINRTKSWISNMVMNWKDADENKIKERLADPHARKNLFSAIKEATKIGALAQAGILLNPVFLFLSITKKLNNKKNMFRIRSEMIGEIKTEIEILDEKINDARNKGDDKQKYQMMRMKNELTKKLLRVGGSPDYEKVNFRGVSKMI